MSDSWTALFIAYAIVWLGLFAFLAYLFLRQRSIDRDIAMLKEEVSRHGK